LNNTVVRYILYVTNKNLNVTN